MGFMEAMMQDVAEKKAALDKLAIKFASEEEALAYAKRLLALKPGDVVKIPNDDNTGFRDAVFIGVTSDLNLQFLYYDEKDKDLGRQETGWGLVKLDD